ncbi:MAG: lysine decarboxylase transcriptional regulator, CadC [Candidatus Angelobacter sp.]|nr:lysine decarboxylase transcriptional regulator, CadC [Candidatus Angelobacter sp.]
MGTVTKYKFDEFEADLRAAELRKGGVRLKLQLQPFQVLVALLERPKDVVTREELRQRLWPEDTFVDFDHGLNTAMVKLRDVLGDSATKPKFIETIAKRGYRFMGTAKAVSDQPAMPADKEPALIEAVPTPAAQPTPQSSNLGTQDLTLPRANRNTARLLFTMAQITYLIFYLSALFRWENTYQASFNTWGRAGSTAFVVYMATSMVGVAVRLYLISATAMDYHLLGSKYRVLMPALFVLDMIWALSPLLIADRIGLGFALGACAALVYMPFAQRTLMKMIQSGR